MEQQGPSPASRRAEQQTLRGLRRPVQAAGWLLQISCMAALVRGIQAGPSYYRCSVFPANNPWNMRVDTLPVHSLSATYLNSIGITKTLKADFGSGLWNGYPIGIPFNVVNSSKITPSNVTFQYASESDKGPYPIPAKPKIEGGSDKHVLMYDSSKCLLYELFAATKTTTGWTAGSGAIFNLSSNALRPAGWTSADAAGLPIFPGLVRWDEVARKKIAHALRFTVSVTQKAYVYPARHYASSSTNPALPPMGLRLRLKKSFNISSFPPQAQVILTAVRDYGLILADNGSPIYISGAPDPHWNNDDLQTLRRVTAADLEVVNASSLMV